MLILVKNKVWISGVDPSTIKKIMDFLTIDNPLFNQKVELGLVTFGVPNRLKYYEYDKAIPDQIIIPVGALPDLMNRGVIAPKLEEIVDQRIVGEAPKFFSKLNFTGELREYQEKIAEACRGRSLGVIEAMTGSGKTATFISIVMEKKIPTLILVNTIELAEQTRKAFLKFTNAAEDEIGFIGSGKFNMSPITVCLHQTMAHLSEEHYKLLNTYFGMVIADEVHIIGATTYYATMNKLEAKFKFGFSATPKRDDGLTPVIHYATGPKIYTVPKEDLKEHLIKPSIEYKLTNYYYPLLSTQEYQEMISDMAFSVDRNEQIVNELKTNYKDNYVILLCNRVEQVERLVNMIGPSAVGLTSKMKKKDRKQAILDLNSKTKRHVVSTFGLFSTGIDIPHLDTLFMCSPIKSEIKVRQSAGRLMRKAEGKTTATIVDFVDHRVELLKYQAAKRKRILNSL